MDMCSNLVTTTGIENVRPHREDEVFKNIWQNFTTMGSLARRNFKNPLTISDKHKSIVVVLDATKPATEYKYPVEKPPYQTKQTNINFSSIALKINISLCKIMKEPMIDDSIDLNDSTLAFEMDNEYKKIMQIKTLFNSPNRLIQFVNSGEKRSNCTSVAETKIYDNEMEVVISKDENKNLTIHLEDVITEDNIIPLPNQVNLKPILKYNPASFIVNDKNSNLANSFFRESENIAINNLENTNSLKSSNINVHSFETPLSPIKSVNGLKLSQISSTHILENELKIESNKNQHNDNLSTTLNFPCSVFKFNFNTNSESGTDENEVYSNLGNSELSQPVLIGDHTKLVLDDKCSDDDRSLHSLVEDNNNLLPIPTINSSLSSNLNLTKANINSDDDVNIHLERAKLTNINPIVLLNNIDFIKAKHVFAVKQDDSCNDISCIENKKSDLNETVASQKRAAFNNDMAKRKVDHNNSSNDSNFVIFASSNQQFELINDLSSTKKIKFESDKTASDFLSDEYFTNKLSPPKKPETCTSINCDKSLQTTNVTVPVLDSEPNQKKVGVKRRADIDSISQNKRQKIESRPKTKNRELTCEASPSNEARWPLYNFSKPEECFAAVKSQWAGVSLPNPHEDLTCRFYNTPPNIHSNFVITGNDDSTIDCLTIYESQIDEIEEEIRSVEFNLDEFGASWEIRLVNKNLNLLDRLKSMRNKLLSAREEAKRFYTHYRNSQTGWNAYYISEYQKNVIRHQFDILDSYPSFYGHV